MGSGRKMYLLASLAFYSLYSLAAASEVKIMTAPNVLRVGTNENIFVECQGCTTGEIRVTIRAWNYPAKSRRLGETSVILDNSNEFQQFGEIKISSDIFSVDDNRNHYVYLQAHFPDQVLEKIALVSFQSGYIFIQTDKTLYTPDSMVKYRLFGVTPQVVPLDEPSTSIDIEILTPEGVSLSLPNGPFSLISGYYDGAYQLSKLASPGIYKVVAKFLSNPQYSYSAEFEVKEYVLPNFEVKLESSEASFRVDREELTIKIYATYLFNEKVEGTATVVFGIVHEGQKKPFPNSVKTVDIIDGEGEVQLSKTDIHPLNINNLIGGSIFVHASVQTEDGAEMVNAELRNIKIVSSPYAIYFRRTPKYFKPGMSFDVVIETLNPDGTPAKKVAVELLPGPVTGNTEENGMARLSINTNSIQQTLEISATTKDHDGPQAKATMTVLPYNSPSKSYIHIAIGKAEVKVGENLKVDFNYNMRDQGRHLTFLVLSKGQLIKLKKARIRIGSEFVVSENILITKSMMPSFRIIAYYHTTSNEVVADSVWVDVQDSCMGSLNLETGDPDRPSYEPKDNIQLKITGDPGATVALVAVDKGVFLLNSKLRLTQQRIWDTVEKHDTGCTPGGGKDHMGVFYDAGLLFTSSVLAGTPSRQELKCPSPSRRKRFSPLQNIQTSLVSQYTDKTLRECCLDGMKKTLLSYTCERRSEYIIDGAACVQAFLRCCKEMETLQAEERKDSLVLARSEETDDDYSPDEIMSRSNFPESWHWTSVRLPSCGEDTCTRKTNPFPLKDTITTWEFVGISFSRENSICVAEPLPVVARKDFFVKLHLPYSVVRKEQVQIKAVVYNYRDTLSTVRVDLIENEKVCSAASRRGFYRQEIRIPARSTRTVPFVIIPSALGLLDIEVQAAVKGRDFRDGVKKKLFVVSEGKLKNNVFPYTLDPTSKGGKDVVTINSRVRSRDMIPGAPTRTMVLVSGQNQISSLVTDIIAGKSLSDMIQLPSGCGEQNMFGMAMTVITTLYLDKTGQWEQVGVDRRPTALEYIRKGYDNERAYRKPDGSFAVFESRPGSTWLTAFVAKVFAMAHKVVAVGEHTVCGALTFLMNQQQDNGRFRDVGFIYSQNMIGDLRGQDSDASMTAFCLIAMQEAIRLCPQQVVLKLRSSIGKAVGYLEGRLPDITNPYAATITSYALALRNKLDRRFLKKFMSPDSTHWPVAGSGVFTIEATAYGLLALVEVQALDEAKPVVRWFQQNQDHLGSYYSTQPTLMVYQAIAEYWSSVTDEPYDLNINLHLPRRSGVTSLFINRDNYMTTRSNELDFINEDVRVVATGTGQATLKVVSYYYAQIRQGDSNCKKFDLNVTFTQDEDEETIYKLTIKVKYLDKEHDADMAILDITLLTGFEPNRDDLNLLSKGPSRVIQRYETNTETSSENKDHRGTLIIYLNKVSHTKVEEITFRLQDKSPGSRLQPAAVTIYEYYDLQNQNDTHCVRFYHPVRPSGELLMLCRHDECTCAEEECTKQKKEKVTNEERVAQSCLSTQETKTDFVFKVKVIGITEDVSTDVFTMEVVQVIKEGTDKGVVRRQREFLSYKHCRWALNLLLDKTYLIMGADRDIMIDKLTQTYLYVLGERTWVEYWPTDEECLTEKHANVCKGIALLKFKYENLLCRQ